MLSFAGQRPRRPAFTLIELLVTVAIIALLLAILIPSLNKARDQAKLVTCMSNLKQFGIAFTLYAADHRHQPPPNRYYSNDPKKGDWWYFRHMLLRYVPAEQLTQDKDGFFGVFACPAERLAGRAYTMSIWACNFAKFQEQMFPNRTGGTPFNPYSIKFANRYLLFGEAPAIHRDAANPGFFGTRYIHGQRGNTPYEKFRTTPESGDRGPFSGYVDFTRHRGRSNFLQSDVHVESLRTSQVVDDTQRVSRLKVLWSPMDRELNSTAFSSPVP
jgi:prepilin-type N-terminal cleavage/methylation domain-containing protein